MAWRYAHLPEKVIKIALKEPNGLVLINSNKCPNQSLQSCINKLSEPCCLGAKICHKVKCYNKTNAAKKRPKTGVFQK